MDEVSSVGDNEEPNAVELIAEGEFLFRKGKYAESLRVFNHVISLDPSQNLAWFNRKDHHGSPEKSLSLSIRELIKKYHDEDFNGPITLLTHLRYFGYVMNPVSFYYCWDKKYQNIDYIIVEINNTPSS